MADKKSLFSRIFYFFRSDTSEDANTSGVSWGLVNEAAATWAKNHAGETITSDPDELRCIQNAVSRFYEEQWNLGRLQKELSKPIGLFDDDRAKTIARNEVTRAAAEGERVTASFIQDGGIAMQPIWQTRNDDLVCDVCKARHDKRIGVDFEEAYPPGCDECRCWVTHRMILDD